MFVITSQDSDVVNPGIGKKFRHSESQDPDMQFQIPGLSNKEMAIPRSP